MLNRSRQAPTKRPRKGRGSAKPYSPSLAQEAIFKRSLPSAHALLHRACLLLLCLLLIPSVPGLTAPSPDAVSALERAVAEAHIPGMAAVVVNEDGIVWAQTYGDCNSLDTPFLLGSLSKSFTALAIMQLAEQGLIDLNAPVTEYVADAPAGVSIDQLLHHTGGLGTHQTLENAHPVSPPGSHVYANVNYALLGKVIETVSGLSYEDYLQTHILEPLGMHHTSADANKSMENGLIQGYENWFGIPVPANAHFPDESDWIQPAAGYIASSAEDMGRYLQMYLHHGEDILSAQGVESMFHDGVDVPDAIPYAYGMGWTYMDGPLSSPVLRHSGLVETGMTCMYILPEQGIGIVFLANMNDYLVGTDLMDRLGWNFVMSCTGDEPGTIEPGTYARSHAGYDTLYIALLALGIVPFFFLGRFRRRCPSWKRSSALLRILLLYGVLPAFLLCVPPLFLDAPLWVVHAFVPDLFLTLWICCILLFSGGVLRLFLWRRQAGRRSAPT